MSLLNCEFKKLKSNFAPFEGVAKWRLEMGD